MKYLAVFMFTALIFCTSLFAKDQERTPLGSATFTLGDETVTWPVWDCGKAVWAHQDPNADLRDDPTLKLVDLDTVIGMVLVYDGFSYQADIPGTKDAHNIDYSATANTFNQATSAFGEAEFTLKLTCNP